MAERDRDRWDKAEILLRPAGALLTALTVALVGFLTSSFLEQRQIIESNTRLYAELMSKREEADSTLRKDMFNSIIQSFLRSESDEEIKQQVLNLELLAYNFHDALDLGPLFKHLRREIHNTTALADGDNPTPYLERLETVSKDVIDKQVAALEEAGGRLDGRIDVAELEDHPEGLPAIDETIADRRFKLEILGISKERKEALVRLIVGKVTAEGLDTEVDSVFRVGFFDFPMIDNTRLSSGDRCAVVLRIFDPVSVEVTLVHFPASRASLKEKPYYDEIIDILRSRQAPETGA